MVFPLCTGGELYEHIIRRGHFTEYDAALLMRDLVGGLDALHQQNILHLDIKPENILFETQDADAKIKITDFGLSRLFVPLHEQEEERGKRGTGGEEQQTDFPTMKVRRLIRGCTHQWIAYLLPSRGGMNTYTCR